MFIDVGLFFIKNHVISYGNPVGMTQNYENNKKQSILITWEPGNTGNRSMLITWGPGHPGKRTILITCEPGDTRKHTIFITWEPGNTAVLRVSELMLWVSELIPLYFGCLNLYFGCLNFQMTATATTASQQLCPSGKAPGPSRTGTEYPVRESLTSTFAFVLLTSVE